MARMSHKLYIPALLSFLKESNDLLSYYPDDTFPSVSSIKTSVERLSQEAIESTARLDALISSDKESGRNEEEGAYFAAKELKGEMKKLRSIIDEAELLVPKRLWPVPTYGDLLFH